MTPAFRAIYGDELADQLEQVIQAAYGRDRSAFGRPVAPRPTEATKTRQEGSQEPPPGDPDSAPDLSGAWWNR